jgi:exopolyphosphatase/guanosine-5'-triphosphate,3'-diphosphate pyrophosphatase
MIRKSGGSSHRKREIRGCCDLGSSSFRLLVVEGEFPEVGRLDDGRLRRVDVHDERRHIGWGDDLVGNGAIGPPALSRALGLLGELLEISRGAGCPAPAIVATNALREARNASAVAGAIERETGMAVRVLSQREEASFGYTGAAFFADRRRELCLVDIGGTSTEVSWGRGTAMDDFAGLPVGTHRVHAALVPRGGGEADAPRIAELLESHDPALPAPGSGVYGLPAFSERPTILVTGGTAVSVATMRRMARGLPAAFEETERMTVEDLRLVRMALAGVLRSGKAGSLPFHPGRVRLLPAGIMLAESLLGALGAREFIVTTRDLRWGVVLAGGGV